MGNAASVTSTANQGIQSMQLTELYKVRNMGTIFNFGQQDFFLTVFKIYFYLVNRVENAYTNHNLGAQFQFESFAGILDCKSLKLIKWTARSYIQ